MFLNVPLNGLLVKIKRDKKDQPNDPLNVIKRFIERLSIRSFYLPSFLRANMAISSQLNAIQASR